MVNIGEGRGPAMVATAIVPFVVTWGFALVRIYVRWFMLKIWKIEDWLFVGSQCTFSVLAIMGLMSALHGNGQHTSTIPLKDISLALEYWFVGQVFYTVTGILIRLSIGFFLLRICLGKLHRWIITITMAFISIVTILYFAFIMSQCRPLSYFWTDYSGTHGKCYDLILTEDITIIYSVCAAATDLTLGILPLFVIYSLRINRKAKIVVGFLLCLGIVAGLSVIVRIEFIHLVNLSHDFLYNTSMVSIWSILEPAIGIICMASSTYRPLIKSLRNQSTYNGSSNGPPYYNDGSAGQIVSGNGNGNGDGRAKSAMSGLNGGFGRVQQERYSKQGMDWEQPTGMNMDVLEMGVGVGVRRMGSPIMRAGSPIRREAWEDMDRYGSIGVLSSITSPEARNLRRGSKVRDMV